MLNWSERVGANILLHTEQQRHNKQCVVGNMNINMFLITHHDRIQHWKAGLWPQPSTFGQTRMQMTQRVEQLIQNDNMKATDKRVHVISSSFGSSYCVMYLLHANATWVVLKNWRHIETTSSSYGSCSVFNKNLWQQLQSTWNELTVTT